MIGAMGPTREGDASAASAELKPTEAAPVVSSAATIALANPRALGPSQLLALQRQVGNRGVGRILARQPQQAAADDAGSQVASKTRWQVILFTPTEQMSAREFRIRTYMQYQGVDRA